MTEHEKLMDFERRLCERLSVPASFVVCECGSTDCAHEGGNCWVCTCTSFRLARKAYPAVSRTGDGMLALVDALDARDWIYGVENLRDGRGVEAYCLMCIPESQDVASALAPTAPLALALAVAKAFGVEVPQ